MGLSEGARLGRYEILRSAGAGGMGEVYRARDTRLDRIVAIKVLPVDLAADTELRQRLEQEARTLAALNHPAICPVHDIGHEDGIDFLVMEFLEGETLAARIVKGPLPMDLVLRYARDMADALAAAHERGIVHRDLKPGNVMITAAGIKLLDFGVAKRRPAGMTARATTLRGPLTAPGSLVGTPQYMAPEVIEGGEADERADLFAFGAIVWEMATGAPVFGGRSASGVMAAVLREMPPPLRTLRADAPAELEHLVATCLAKDPAARWRSSRDASLLLGFLAGRAGSIDTQTTTVRRGRPVLPWAIAIAAVAGALGVLTWSRPWEEAIVDTTVRRVSVLPPPGTSFTVEEAPQISPDGTRLVFAAVEATGSTRLYVRSLEALDARVLAGTDGATLPFWSPDSTGIGFFADGWLKVIESVGSAPRALARTSNPRGGAWRRDGVILFTPFPPQPPQVVSLRGGQPVETTTIPPDAPPIGPDPTRRRWFPQWLPEFDEYLYLAGTGNRPGGNIAIADVKGASTVLSIPSGSGAVYVAPGYLLFRRDESIVALPFDVRAREVRGDAVTLVSRVTINPILFQTPFSVSDNGVLAYLDAVPGSQIARVDRSGSQIDVLGAPGTHNGLCASVDDRHVVADGTDERSSNLDIWLLGRGGASTTRLTFHEAHDMHPVCSPDGSEVVFGSLRTGAPDLYRLSTSAPGTERLLLDTPFAKIPTHWSNDGRWLIFTGVTERGDWDVWALPMKGDPKPVRLVATPAHDREGRLSPDSRWLAYASNESGRYEIYVQPFPPSGGKWQVSGDGGTQPYWRADGKELFYLSADRAVTASTVTVAGSIFTAGPPRPLFHPRLVSLENHFALAQFAPSSSGDTFILNRMSDVAAARAANLILNWPALLER